MKITHLQIFTECFFVEILILLVNYDEVYFGRYVNAELIEY